MNNFRFRWILLQETKRQYQYQCQYNVFNAASDNVDDNWRDFIEGFLLAISFSSYPIVYRHPSNVIDDEWTQFKFIDRLMYRWYTSLSFCYTIIILKYLSNRLLHRHRLFFLWRFLLLLLLLEIIISWIFLPFFLDLFFLADVHEDYYADPFTSNSSLCSYVFYWRLLVIIDRDWRVMLSFCLKSLYFHLC